MKLAIVIILLQVVAAVVIKSKPRQYKIMIANEKDPENPFIGELKIDFRDVEKPFTEKSKINFANVKNPFTRRLKIYFRNVVKYFIKKLETDSSDVKDPLIDELETDSSDVEDPLTDESETDSSDVENPPTDKLDVNFRNVEKPLTDEPKIDLSVVKKSLYPSFAKFLKECDLPFTEENLKKIQLKQSMGKTNLAFVPLKGEAYMKEEEYRILTDDCIAALVKVHSQDSRFDNLSNFFLFSTCAVILSIVSLFILTIVSGITGNYFYLYLGLGIIAAALLLCVLSICCFHFGMKK